jgi:hypothetical protein
LLLSVVDRVVPGIKGRPESAGATAKERGRAPRSQAREKKIGPARLD